MEIEIPRQDFRIPAVGIISFTFDRLRCKNFEVDSENKNGFYLTQDHLGVSLKFSVFCFTNAKQSKNGRRLDGGLLGSSINLNITGSYLTGELGFAYDLQYYQIIPILQKLNASFDLIDVSPIFVNHRFKLLIVNLQAC
jgi:hypothetical protein